MRALIAVLFAALASTTSADVIVGELENWDELLKKDFLLAEFYAPWCGHCKKLAPEWEKAASEVEGMATLVKVDATLEKELSDKYHIESYPTIKAFFNGQMAKYEGGRTAPEIVSWVRRMAGSAVHVIPDKEQLAIFRGHEAVVVVAYLPEGSDDAAAYEKVATENRKDVLFGVSHSADLAKAEGITMPGMAVYKDFDKNTAIAEFDPSKLINFIKLNSFPLFDEISSSTYKLYLERGLPIGWLFVDPEKVEETTAVKEAVKKAASNVIGKASMVWLDGVDFGQMAERVGIKQKVWPAFSFDLKGTSYLPPSNVAIDSDEFQQWVIDWADGKIDAQLKSDDIPSQPTTNGLTVVVANTFKEIVYDKKKDVLIKFHAPWCGHCKKMMPEYEALAKTFENDDSIIVAKIDGTTNEVPKDLDIQGYPTILLITSDTNEIIKFEGGRTAADMEEFIRKNAKSL